RETDTIRIGEPGDRDPDPPSDEHADAVHAKPAQLIYKTQAPCARRIYLRGERVLDHA
ncbi:hypothetical protein O3G_MSEX007438, partial [Manduca sexta]